MLNIFKKKDIKIYEVMNYFHKHDITATILIPKKMNEIFYKFLGNRPDIWLHKYLRLIPKDFFKDEELEVHQHIKWFELDVENTWWFQYCVSEKFKNFAEKEKLWLEFYPVIARWKRMYIMLWQTLPVISDYEMDVEKSKYSDMWFVEYSDRVFRSDFIEYYGYQMFSNSTHSMTFITWELKEKFDKQWFLLNYKELPITQKKLDKKEIEKDLLYARERERELYLIDRFKEKYQKADDILEKVLVEEWNKKLLKKFREEIKWEWKKDFERYEKWEMEPMEKIHFW